MVDMLLPVSFLWLILETDQGQEREGGRGKDGRGLGLDLKEFDLFIHSGTCSSVAMPSTGIFSGKTGKPQ
jgi:hypothetical protein